MRVRQVVPRDAIPSVDTPTFGEDYDGRADDDAIVVDSDPPRAYPLRYLNYHEIVNDTIDSGPIAVTWCPLCASAIVYDREVDDRVLTFGVSGKLADDDLVMYDRETESEWKQSLGRSIAGPLAGHELTVLPATITPIGQFRDSYSDGLVLQPPGGKSEASGPGPEPRTVEYESDPYDDYFSATGFGLDAHRGDDGRSWDRDDLGPKTIVFGFLINQAAKAVPLPVIENSDGVVSLRVGGRSISLFDTPNGVHAYFDEGLTFSPTDDGNLFRANGTEWTGTNGTSDDGRSLNRAPFRRLFAFTWQDDHGPEAFYFPDEGPPDST